MINFSDCFRSIIQFLKIKRHKIDVVFYYPQHFNRSKESDNEFLKPLINSCNKANISYLIFEEPASTSYPRNKKAVKFDFIFWLILILRKLIPLRFFNNFDERDWKIAKMIKPFLFSKFKPKVIITMSNSMVAFFRGLFSEAEIYDYQHGIIYATHPGYLVNHKPADHFINNNSNVLIYGEGFKKLLINANNDFFEEHAVVLGTNAKYQNFHQKFNGNIIITLPIATKGEIRPIQNDLLNQLTTIFATYQDFYLSNDIHFFVRHHPRYDGSVDINNLFAYPFVKVINGDLNDNFKHCSLHLTFNSTTTFDAAIVGVPTLFLGNLVNNKLFQFDFNYPDFESCLNVQQHVKELVNNQEKYLTLVNKAQEWVKTYYRPFNEQKFLALLHGKN